MFKLEKNTWFYKYKSNWYETSNFIKKEQSQFWFYIVFRKRRSIKQFILSSAPLEEVNQKDEKDAEKLPGANIP